MIKCVPKSDVNGNAFVDVSICLDFIPVEVYAGLLESIVQVDKELMASYTQRYKDWKKMKNN